MTTNSNVAVVVDNSAVRENRYVRTARVLIKARENNREVDAEQLASVTEMQTPTAHFCIEAFNGVLQALSEAGYTVSKVVEHRL